jgi:hypothetical protein
MSLPFVSTTAASTPERIELAFSLDGETFALAAMVPDRLDPVVWEVASGRLLPPEAWQTFCGHLLRHLASGVSAGVDASAVAAARQEGLREGWEAGLRQALEGPPPPSNPENRLKLMKFLVHKGPP